MSETQSGSTCQYVGLQPGDQTGQPGYRCHCTFLFTVYDPFHGISEPKYSVLTVSSKGRLSIIWGEQSSEQPGISFQILHPKITHFCINLKFRSCITSYGMFAMRNHVSSLTQKGDILGTAPRRGGISRYTWFFFVNEDGSTGAGTGRPVLFFGHAAHPSTPRTPTTAPPTTAPPSAKALCSSKN